MAVNKRKILESAQKYLQKGALDRALKEYRTLLELDPRDSSARLKLGDILLRLGDKNEAVAAYLKVAHQFMKEGFDPKAVALFKQIARLAPEQTDIFVPLAELYQRLGLVAEAMSALQTATEAFQKAGRKREALDLLRKAAALDPSNTTSRLKIADLLRQQGMMAEALAEYDEVATELERAGEGEALATIYERVLEIEPDRMPTVLALARLLLASGAAERASALTAHAVTTRPDLIEALELHAETLQALGRAVEETESVFRSLAEAHRARGNEERAREILQRFLPACDLTLSGVPSLDLAGDPLPASERLLSEERADAATESVLDEVDFTDVEFEPLAPLPPGVCVGTAPSENSAPEPAPRALPGVDLEQLLAEAGVYVRFGKRDKAIASLESVLSHDPEHTVALEKLAETLAAAGDGPRAAGWFRGAATAACARGDEVAAARFAARCAALEDGSAVCEAAGEVFADPDAAALVVEHDANHATGQPSTILAVSAGEAAAPTDPSAELDFEIELDLSEADAIPEIDRDRSMTAGSMQATRDEESERDRSAALDTGLALGSASATDRVEGVPLEPAAPSPKQILEELEEADFYLQQGLLDEAERVYRQVLETVPTNPQALLRLGEIAAARGDDPGSSHAVLRCESDLDEPAVPAVPSDAQTDGAISPTQAFGDDLADWGVAPPGGEASDEPTPLDADARESTGFAGGPGAATAAMDLASVPETFERGRTETGGAAASDALASVSRGAPEASHFDLAAELSSALRTEEIASQATAAEVPEESLEAIFDEFKRGVRKTLTTADHETHYDLGIAYREMGLLDDAMGEFQIALESPARRVDCLHLLGVCARELKRAHDAVAFLEQALAEPDLTPPRRAAIRFDLAIALEERGDLADALAAFEAVAAEEPSHPGLADRIDALRALATLTPSQGAEACEAEPAEVYESFDDLIAHAEAELVTTGTPARPLQPETTSPAPEAGDRGPTAPAPGTSPRRRKISFG